MKGYASQIPDPEDRWAIAAWIRVLQVSHGAKQSDIPAQFAQNNQPNAKAVAQ